jgi:hypothetical protein
MSINRIVILAAVAGYLLVNIGMQIDFFAGRDIFSKYQEASSPAEAHLIAEKAYYAKTAFLLILLVLLTCNVPFGLGFGLSFLAYAAIMLVFFGLGRMTAAYLAGSTVLLVSYFIDRPGPQ